MICNNDVVYLTDELVRVEWDPPGLTEDPILICWSGLTAVGRRRILQLSEGAGSPKAVALQTGDFGLTVAIVFSSAQVVAIAQGEAFFLPFLRLSDACRLRPFPVVAYQTDSRTGLALLVSQNALCIYQESGLVLYAERETDSLEVKNWRSDKVSLSYCLTGRENVVSEEMLVDLTRIVPWKEVCSMEPS